MLTIEELNISAFDSDAEDDYLRILIILAENVRKLYTSCNA